MHHPAVVRPFSGRLTMLALVSVFVCAPAHAADPANERLYFENCAACHGERGDGMSRARSGLNPPPRDFTDPAVARELTREQMIRAVTEGRPGTAMVAWGRQLSEAQIAGVVDFVRERFMGPALAQAAPGDGAAPRERGPEVAALSAAAPSAPLSDPASGAGSALGAEVYRDHCATCHGDRGAGASWTENSFDPPPRDFTAAAARAELTPERMLASVTDGRPGTAMMSFRARLAPEEIRAVVDHIRAEFMGVDPGPEPRAVAATAGAGGASGAGEAADMSLPFPGGLAGDIDAGRIAYAENCRPCHGRDGDGRGERASFIHPPPRDFLSPETRRTLNRPALFGAIASGKQGTVMPAWKTVMDAQEIADVGEYVFSTFVRPAPEPVAEDARDEAKKKTELMPAGAPAEGRRVYNAYCYYCHGYNGDGRTVAARFLDPAPRAFIDLEPGDIGREEMIATVAGGRSGTAMKAHANVLDAGEIEAVVDFVRENFIERKAVNTWYHIPENGWFDHERYRDAFPFALGEIALDAPEDELSAAERRGKRLFMSSCITCHDRAHLNDDRTLWAPRAVSWPRAGYSHRTGPAVDAASGATPYSRHDTPPRLDGASERERRGETIFQANCAFCHAADGTGRNWIGSFLEPAPRDLTDPAATAGLTPERLRAAIANGIDGTPMSAWRRVLDEADIDAVAAYVERVFLSDARGD